MAFRSGAPHLNYPLLAITVDFGRPVLELLRDVVVELQSRTQACAFFAIELELEERPLVYLFHHLHGRGNQLVSLYLDLLSANLLDVILSSFLGLVQVLLEEVD